MKKFLEKCKKSILFYVIIYTLVLIISREILLLFNLNYRQFIYIISLIVIVVGFISGVIQLLLKLKNKTAKIVLILLFVLLLIYPVLPLGILLGIFSYMPEKVVMKDNEKMVTYTTSFWDTNIYYYKYINPLVRSKKLKIHEKYSEYDIYTITYYDDEGNIIKEESKEFDKSKLYVNN